MATHGRERTRLTRGRIVDAALEIVDAEGVEGLSMRRLGQHLGVDPMAIYYHVPNKAALHDGIVERIWQGLALPEASPGQTWQQLIAAVFIAFRARLLEHPRAVVLVGTRPSVSPGMLRLIDDSLGRLEAAGMAGVDAMQLIDCLSGYTVGKVLAELREAGGGPGEPTELEPTIARLTPRTHPHLAQTLASGYAFDPERQFTRGLHALIDGWR